MATPPYIREIRAAVGHHLLWMPGVSAIVLDETGRVLLGRRADTGEWSIIGGIPDPGEQPGTAIVREVYEETAVRCVAERVLLVQALMPVTYPNGDVCQYMDICFLCRAVGGEARVNDDESLEVGWFEVDALPPMEEFAVSRIKQATAGGPTWFEGIGDGREMNSCTSPGGVPRPTTM
ncbi:NUDIX domain-containing protein [Streptomyces sp. ISL-11]|uniref:NUDIX hydrolase n=1 Tax=Streptomyces sp. ISL-11 TaxID=2819174 RepID=UPI001BE81BD3|nr:NUDIX domain-containing protein [Streptomyces sp. ISL-11]MBT2382885.1 NUDIX domain-containing protein [Streptomyces sp. ISL-11]